MLCYDFFLYIYTYFKSFMTVSSLSGYKFKILEGPFEGEPDCVIQNFVRFNLFLMPTHFENLMHLNPMLKNFKIM